LHCLSLDPGGTSAGEIASENVSHNWRRCPETANIRHVFQLILPFQLDLPFADGATIPARANRDEVAARTPDNVGSERTGAVAYRPQRAAVMRRGIQAAR
jgi:hypothetical protein